MEERTGLNFLGCFKLSSNFNNYVTFVHREGGAGNVHC